MAEKTTPDLLNYIRSIPDFPKPGILFYDITPLLGNPQAFRQAVHELAEQVRPLNADLVVAAEARGFLFAAPLAVELGVGLVPVRKPGKLPYKTMSYTYELEYGTDTLEIHVDAIPQGARVLIVDDLLATGGTVNACRQLVGNAGGKVVGSAFLIELVGLEGAKKVGTPEIISLLKLE